jgi:hypothetical protein
MRERGLREEGLIIEITRRGWGEGSLYDFAKSVMLKVVVGLVLSRLRQGRGGKGMRREEGVRRGGAGRGGAGGR